MVHKLTLYTLSWNLQKEYQAVLGFKIDHVKEDHFLLAAFSYTGEWKIHGYDLGNYESAFAHPEAVVRNMLQPFLNDVVNEFEGTYFECRREGDEWIPKWQVFHEWKPYEIEISLNDFNKRLPVLVPLICKHGLY